MSTSPTTTLLASRDLLAMHPTGQVYPIYSVNLLDVPPEPGSQWSVAMVSHNSQEQQWQPQTSRRRRRGSGTLAYMTCAVVAKTARGGGGIDGNISDRRLFKVLLDILRICHRCRYSSVADLLLK